jgi:hypothetical protein
MTAVSKKFFFEKKNQNTFGSTGVCVANMCLRLSKKSWMPAFAGMTGEGAGGKPGAPQLFCSQREVLPSDV